MKLRYLSWLAMSVFCVACGDDDGGVDASPDQAVETGTTDLGSPETSTPDAMPACGDGVIDTGETCDDENQNDADGCSGTCDVEENFACEGEPSTCVRVCGNGVVDEGETCDIANDSCPRECPGDADDACIIGVLNNPGTCTAECTTRTVTEALGGDMCCPAGIDPAADYDCPAECGNSIVESGEQCDDGNAMIGDGCDSCVAEGLETGFRATKVELRDPHIFVEMGICIDGTDIEVGDTKGANPLLRDFVDALSINVIPVFRPFDPSAATTPISLSTSASCEELGGQITCARSADEVLSIATNQTSGTCLTPVPDSLNLTYAAANVPVAPCFVSNEVTITVPFAGGTSIALENARIAGTYMGDDEIDNGLLVGFLTFDAARAVSLPLGATPVSMFDVLNGGNGCGMPSDADDRNGDGIEDGWWFYLDIEATRVPLLPRQ